MTAADDGRPSTSRDVLDMLRRHYLPEGKQPPGIFAPEIEAPRHHRRADLIWQGVTNATRTHLIGHEIKVSRADVLVELNDPTKADPWQQYCDRWWLVIPDPVLIVGLDLPPSWGVLGPPSGRRTRSMTVLVPAPELKPIDKAPAYETIARWLHWRNHGQGLELARDRGELRRLREQNHDLQRQVPLETPRRRALDAVIEEIVRKLGGPNSDGQFGDWSSQSVGVDDVVAALRDLGSVYDRAQRVEFRAREAQRSLARLVEGIPADAIADVSAAVAALGQQREVA